jgi:hypothetical protein
MKLFFRNYIVVLAVVILGGISALYAQNAGQLQMTPVGNEQVQIYPPGTAANVYMSVASLRDGRGWVFLAPLTGFTLTMTTLQSVVSLNPAAGIAAGTIVLPPTLDDGKSVSIWSSNTITALTLSTSNGATFVPAAPTTLVTPTALEFVYDKANNQWHRFQ